MIKILLTDNKDSFVIYLSGVAAMNFTFLTPELISLARLKTICNQSEEIQYEYIDRIRIDKMDREGLLFSLQTLLNLVRINPLNVNSKECKMVLCLFIQHDSTVRSKYKGKCNDETKNDKTYLEQTQQKNKIQNIKFTYNNQVKLMQFTLVQIVGVQFSCYANQYDSQEKAIARLFEDSLYGLGGIVGGIGIPCLIYSFGISKLKPQRPQQPQVHVPVQ